MHIKNVLIQTYTEGSQKSMQKCIAVVKPECYTDPRQDQKVASGFSIITIKYAIISRMINIIIS